MKMFIHDQLEQRSRHSHTLMIFLLLGLILLLQGCFCLGERACSAYKVPEASRDMCVPCRLCSADSHLVHTKCKAKYSTPIVNQGFAWCTAPTFPRPSCPKWEVANGNITCDILEKFSVGSKCKVQCNDGYSATFETQVECLEELHWSVGESLRPSCIRTGLPGQPKIISSAIRSQVRPDSDVKLTCNNTTVPVGLTSYFWYFNNQELQNEAHSNTYNIMTAQKKDEGIYRCVIQDKIGKSATSPGYHLEVENNPSEGKTAVWIIAVTVGIAILILSLTLMYLLKKTTYLPKMGCCTSNGSEKDGTSESNSSFVSNIESGNDEESETLANLINHKETPSLTKLTRENPFVSRHPSESFSNATRNFENGNDEGTLPLTNIINGEDIQSLASLTHSGSHSVCIPASSSFPGTEENQTQTSHAPSYSQNCSTPASHLMAVADNDQKALRKLLDNKKIVDQIVVKLDQHSDQNRNHPTFKDLGRFLRLKPDRIAHIEYICGQYDSSPTVQLLQKMKYEGLGFNLLKQFLELHDCSELIKMIHTEMQWEIH